MSKSICYCWCHCQCHCQCQILVSMSIALAIKIVEESGFNIHAYADDLQIYTHGDPLRSASMVNRLSDCVDVVQRLDGFESVATQSYKDRSHLGWGHARVYNTAQNLLCLYPVGSSLHLHRLEISSSLWILNFPWLLMSTILSRSVRSIFVNYAWFAIHSISMAAHALIRLRRLQIVLNSSACLLFQLPGRESVSIRMRNELHWLRFHSGSHTNCACWRSRRSTIRLRSTWCHVAFGFQSDAGRARLRSASSGQLVVPRTSKKTFGDRLLQAPDPSHGTVCPV